MKMLYTYEILFSMFYTSFLTWSTFAFYERIWSSLMIASSMASSLRLSTTKSPSFLLSIFLMCLSISDFSCFSLSSIYSRKSSCLLPYALLGDSLSETLNLLGLSCIVESSVLLCAIISFSFLFKSEIYLFNCLRVSDVISWVKLLSDIFDTDSWTFHIYWFSFVLSLFSYYNDDFD